MEGLARVLPCSRIADGRLQPPGWRETTGGFPTRRKGNALADPDFAILRKMNSPPLQYDWIPAPVSKHGAGFAGMTEQITPHPSLSLKGRGYFPAVSFQSKARTPSRRVRAGKSNIYKSPGPPVRGGPDQATATSQLTALSRRPRRSADRASSARPPSSASGLSGR